jgi:hypothetical protein
MYKNLKKIISLIIVLAISSNTSFVFAEVNSNNKCEIDNTPKYIIEYIKDLRKVVSNISSRSVEKRIEKQNSFWKTNNRSYDKVYWTLNSLFTWKWYSSNFEYSIWENTNEIPNQAKRDIKILEKEKDNLNKYYQNFAKKDLSQVMLTKGEICEWLDDEKCGKHFNKERKSIDILLKASRSINSLLFIIKNNATNGNIWQWKNYFLLKDEDIESIKKDYSVESLQACNKLENPEGKDWFFKTAIDAIKKISLTWEKSEGILNQWDEAYKLLLWNTQDEKEKKRERQLLSQELQKQGIGWDWASAILWNLDYYNKNWNRKWLKDQYQSYINLVGDESREFNETIKGLQKQISENKWISAKDFESKLLSIRWTEQVKISINLLYGKLKESSLQDDNINETLINRMVKMHINISEWINTLNKTCKVSVRVCNSQKKGQWDCGKCY